MSRTKPVIEGQHQQVARAWPRWGRQDPVSRASILESPRGSHGDRKSLGIIGFILGGVTAGVMTIGMVVVQGHLDGRLSLDGAHRLVVPASLPTTMP
jgi:hypothetical protein